METMKTEKNEKTENPENQNAISRELFQLTDVVQVTGLSKSSIRRLEHAGNFPKRVRLSPRRVAWKQTEVMAFIRSREVV